MKKMRTRPWVVAAGVEVTLTSLSACGGGSSDNNASGDGGGAAITTINVWDPYPQYDDSSAWAKYLQGCAPAGTTINRTASATSDLLNNLTSAVKEGNAPDVVMLDNPAVPDAATAGLLAPASTVGFDTSGFDANLAGPGTVDGTTYGVPIGANTLGLYYNADLLQKDGVDPSSITSWSALDDALAKVTAAGDQGITFAGITGEEGTFQFLPWFWGAGGSLTDLSSDAGTQAGDLLSGWIGKGYAPKSAISDNQSASWDLFLTGKYAFAENGSWFAHDAAKLKFDAQVMPIPSENGGAAPVPTGGEFVLAPVQKNDADAHYAAAKQVIDCLVSPSKQVQTADELGYFSATSDTRAKQIASDKVWTPWTDAIDNAQGRTSDLGAGYTETSAAISTAEQTALNAAGDTNAVQQAFQQAAQSVQ